MTSRTHVATALALAIASTFAAPSYAVTPVAPKSAIAWQMAAGDAEVDKAFAAARREGKPVFLYWGAVWCPPCNQVKATLFPRADFVERSRAFIAVYVDGDKPGAQKVASRFKVSGYPTMVLFKPDGTEITRLPGEVDPERYLLTLTSALNAQVPVRELMQRGLAKATLSAEQWRMLAYYSWDTDQQQVVKSDELADTLSRLADAVPRELDSVRDRLALKAVVARVRSEAGAGMTSRIEDRQVVERILSQLERARDVADLLIGYGPAVAKGLSKEGADRTLLATKWDAALQTLSVAAPMSRSDQIDALDARVGLWKLADGDALSPARRQQVTNAIAQVVAQTTDRYERQAVVPSAAHVLTEAGLSQESDALLKAELTRAVAPYYHMLVLAGNARKRGDAQAALQWYEQAWRKSEGPATRLQWGTNYVGNVLDLAPNDVARVTSATSAVFQQLEPHNETFYERNQRSLQRLAKRLSSWQGQDPARRQAVARLKTQLEAMCRILPAKNAGRANCESIFTTS